MMISENLILFKNQVFSLLKRGEKNYANDSNKSKCTNFR